MPSSLHMLQRTFCPSSFFPARLMFSPAFRHLFLTFCPVTGIIGIVCAPVYSRASHPSGRKEARACEHADDGCSQHLWCLCWGCWPAVPWLNALRCQKLRPNRRLLPLIGQLKRERCRKHLLRQHSPSSAGIAPHRLKAVRQYRSPSRCGKQIKTAVPFAGYSLSAHDTKPSRGRICPDSLDSSP